MSRIEQAWQSRGWLACALWPLSLFYRVVMAMRRQAYRLGLAKVTDSKLPVVVVGNISVGGTGKTPLCAHLVQVFQSAGWQPAIVSRGYGGKRHELPHLIAPSDSPEQVGDEPLMLFQQTGVPVCVCVKRALAVEHLANHTTADIIFADDGLQHLAMARHAEIVVVDGARGVGNGWLLPAGPLRESTSRFGTADVIAVQASEALHHSLGSTGKSSIHTTLTTQTFSLNLTQAVALEGGRCLSLDEFAGQAVVAMAGIGHPERFFNALRQRGLQVTGVAKPDHHTYTLDDLGAYASTPVLVTSKDAVKIRALGASPVSVFEVPASVTLSGPLYEKIVQLEKELRTARIETAHSCDEFRLASTTSLVR